MHPNFSRVNQEQNKQKTKSKQSTTIERDEINLMNIINDNAFNLYYNLLNYNKRYI